MGKTRNTILKVKDYSIYPYLLRAAIADKQGYRGINFRVTIANKKGKGTTTDVELYDSSGIRIKARTNDFVNGRITGGYTPDLINDHNNRIAAVQSAIVQYLDANNHLSKPLLLEHIYGSEFIEKHTYKRNKYVTIPVHDKGAIVDSYSITKQEITDLIKDQITKQTFINSDGKPKTIEGIFDSETGESMIEDEEDAARIITNAKTTKEQKVKNEKLKAEIELMSVEDRYAKGYYNKEDLIETVYAEKYGKDKFNGSMIFHRFLEYEIRTKTKTPLKDFKYEWVVDFINFFQKNGYNDVKTQSITPFNFNSYTTRFLDAPNKKFTDSTFNANLKWLRLLLRRLNDKEIIKWKDRDIDKLNTATFGIKYVNEKTRKSDSLFKDEFDQIFKVQLVDDYEIKKHNRNKQDVKIGATKEELEKSRDIFILMTWLGGLRPSEYNSENIILTKDGKGNYKVNYFTSDKNKVEVENPVVNYAETIIKRHKGKLPFWENTKKADLIYLNHLKLIAKQAGLDREFFRSPSYGGKVLRVKRNVGDNINRYFARKTFIQILRDEGISIENISAFTGHQDGANINAYYTNSIPLKRKLIEKIKPK